MKKRILLGLIPFALLGMMLFQVSCVKENFDKIPFVMDKSDRTVTLSIRDLKTLLTDKNTVYPIDTAKVYKVNDLFAHSQNTTLVEGVISINKQNNVSDSSLVISGYVTTSDSTGNFYKVITIQDETGGIDIKINDTDIYTLYRLKPGQQVLVKVNDLYLSLYHGLYQLGAAIVEEGANSLVGIPPAQVNTYIEKNGFRKHLVPDTLTINQINKSYYQKLVCIKNIQFKDPYTFTKYSEVGENTNRSIVDCDGNTLALHNSGYATFFDSIVPTGKGTMTGILGVYDQTNQLTIRDLNDVKLTGSRCDQAVPTVSHTIAQLKALCTGSSLNITSDIVITGVVTGDDETGNIYKQLNIQDQTGGITVSINATTLYSEFPVGTRVVINCNGLCIGKYGGVVQLGMPVYSTYVQRIEPTLLYKKIFVVERNVPVVSTLTKISGINNSMINTLITIDEDVQFSDSDLGKAYTELASSSATNRNLENIVGGKLIVRTSKYASFATTPLPLGKGRVTGILTKYNSDFQLALRDLNDVKLDNPRFSFILSEGFSSAVVGNAISVNGWKTVAEAGTRTFKAQQYSGDNYAEMNPYNSGEANNTAWLISPAINVANVTNPTLIFQTEYNYWSSTTSYSVWISTDYNGGPNASDVTSAHWSPLSSARLVQQADGKNIWVNSGLVDLSAYSGNVYVGFKYINTGGTNATAFRVDNVKVFSNQ